MANPDAVADTPTAPLPSLDSAPRGVQPADQRLVDEFIAILDQGGVMLMPELRQKLEEKAATWRLDKIDTLGAAYLVICLHAAGLHQAVATLQKASHPSPHSAERVIAFKDEFDKLMAIGASPFMTPAFEHSKRLNQEIRLLQQSKKLADSAYATLQRVAADLGVALTSHEIIRQGEVTSAAEQVYDLIQTELQAKPEVTGVYPGENELSAAYYPVDVTEVEQLKKGDIILDAGTKQVVYQYGNPRERITVGNTEGETETELLGLMQGRTIMRPFGSQGVLMLRTRLATQRLKVLAAAEEKMGKTLHTGRAQGMKLALELLNLPTWSLAPLNLKPNQPEKSNENPDRPQIERA